MHGNRQAADTTTVYRVDPGLRAASVPLGRPATQRQAVSGEVSSYKEWLDGQTIASICLHDWIVGWIIMIYIYIYIELYINIYIYIHMYIYI